MTYNDDDDYYYNNYKKIILIIIIIIIIISHFVFLWLLGGEWNLANHLRASQPARAKSICVVYTNDLKLPLKANGADQTTERNRSIC